jgi:RNA polymerase sigma-70 factor (ECF subfamily)
MSGRGDIDRALVRRALSADPEAYRDLFDRYYGGVMRYCTASLGGDRDAAADAAQESFIRAFKSLASLKEPERFGSWVYAIADNVCRTTRHRAAAEADKARRFAVERFEGPEDESPVLRERKVELVRAELEALPEGPQRDLIRAYYGEDNVTTRELADRTGMPHGTVCVTLSRLRAKIQKRLAAALLRLEASA